MQKEVTKSLIYLGLLVFLRGVTYSILLSMAPEARGQSLASVLGVAFLIGACCLFFWHFVFKSERWIVPLVSGFTGLVACAFLLMQYLLTGYWPGLGAAAIALGIQFLNWGLLGLVSSLISLVPYKLVERSR